MKCADIQKFRAAGLIYCVIGLAGLTGILVSALVALPALAGPETPESSNPTDDIRRLAAGRSGEFIVIEMPDKSYENK